MDQWGHPLPNNPVLGKHIGNIMDTRFLLVAWHAPAHICQGVCSIIKYCTTALINPITETQVFTEPSEKFNINELIQ